MHWKQGQSAYYEQAKGSLSLKIYEMIMMVGQKNKILRIISVGLVLIECVT